MALVAGFWPSVFLGILSILPILLLYYYIKCRSSYQVLKRNGIRGPAPSFFFGHYKQRVKLGAIEYMRQLHQEYGPIVGLYLGRIPQISVTDMELLKLITVKDFDSFPDRASEPDVITVPLSLINAKGDIWKRMRQAISPTFSTLKLKAMTPIVQRSVASLLEVFQGHVKEGKSFDVNKVYGSFAMETILAAAFGRVIEIQKGESDQLTQAAAAIFTGNQEQMTTSIAYVTMLLSNIPWLKYVFQLLLRGSFREKAIGILKDAAIRVIQERRKEGNTEKHKDLLQLMIDATCDDGDAVSGSSGGKKKLTDVEITGNAIFFMLAGYETTASTLGYTSYLLALNPPIQEKLQQEIDHYYEENPAAQDLEYLDMVIQESLRLFPPNPMYTRECVVKDYQYQGITIPKGSHILIPCILLHMDPEYWKDPETFDPMRFTVEEKAKRPQLSHLPFGFGPRNCIASRLALLEVKLALIELLRSSTFVRTPDTEVPLETIFGVTMSPVNGIYLKVVTRKSQSTPDDMVARKSQSTPDDS